MENRAGTYQINLSGETEYKSFVPNALPQIQLLKSEMIC